MMLLVVSGAVGGRAPVAWGQRVQIPRTPQAYSPQTFPQATVGGYPASSQGTFAAPGLTPGYGAPAYNPPAAYNPAAVTPPPAFDAYAPGTVSGTAPAGLPPTNVPYAYSQAAPGSFPQAPAVSPFTQPYGAAPGAMQPYPTSPGAFPVTPSAPQQGLYPNGSPYNWQSGSYGYQSADGNLVRFQKFLQRVGLEYTWLAGSTGPNDMEMNRLELAATFGIPVMHNMETPLLITPGFAVNFLSGPVSDPAAMPRGPDMPGQVYDAYLDLSWYPQPFEWFGAELGFRTGVWTDFDTVNSQSVRYLGRALGVITISPRMEVLVGVVYLDRLRVKLLPAGGVHWRPNQNWDLYIVFPNPKFRRTIQSVGTTDWWWYVAGEYGGGSWTVSRAGLDDRVDYNDIRIVTGFEWESPRQVRGHLEVGYVFDRELVFASDAPSKATLDKTFMLRAGIDF